MAKITADYKISKAAAEGALNSVMDGVRQILKKGDSMTLVGFDTISVGKRAARKGRNPQIGKKIHIPAKNVVKSKAGKGLSEAV